MKSAKNWVLLLVGMALTLSACASSPQGRIYVGIQNPYFVLKPGLLKDYRAAYGGQPKLVGWPVEWGHPFPTDEVLGYIENQAVTVIEWHLPTPENGFSDPLSMLKAGDWDSDLRDWADGLKKVRYPVMIWLSAPELGWSRSEYEAAFTYIANYFKRGAVSNVLWVMETNITPSLSELPDHWVLVNIASLAEIPEPTFQSHYPVLLRVRNLHKRDAGQTQKELVRKLNNPQSKIRAIVFQDQNSSVSVPPDGLATLLKDAVFDANLDDIQEVE